MRVRQEEAAGARSSASGMTYVSASEVQVSRRDRQRNGGCSLFPTDLPAFLDLIRQHGDAAYSLMFAYAASHSLLLTLFAGYAASSGALGTRGPKAACTRSPSSSSRSSTE